ncbi:MAG: DUF1292 domain-containing protein [Acutalibacteraceae bacterium]
MDKEMEQEFEANLISLIDDNGDEYEFEILDEIDFEDSHYLALMPLFELPDGDAEETYMIFEAIEDGDEPQLVEVEDDDLLDKLAEIFEKHFDEFDELEEDLDKE